MSGQLYRVGFDIGGTFTDFALHDDEQGTVRIHKALTTPDDPWRGAIDGIRALLDAAGLDFADLAEIVHGTTLITNALIEGKGAPTALLATRGFRDVMESGREQRYDIYDLFLQYPPTLVQRKFRREITERMSAAGRVLAPVDLDQVRREAARLRDAGIRSVAVCFLHSYRNPAHELAVGRLLAAEFPEFSVSLSCEVAPRSARIRTHLHHRRQRLRSSADRPLCRNARSQAARTRILRPPVSDALFGRARDHRRRAAVSGTPAGVGPCRRCARHQHDEPQARTS